MGILEKFEVTLIDLNLGDTPKRVARMYGHSSCVDYLETMESSKPSTTSTTSLEFNGRITSRQHKGVKPSLPE